MQCCSGVADVIHHAVSCFAMPCVRAMQAVKNEAEIAGMREAHLRDAVAMASFLCFVEKEIAAGKTFTEVQIDEELTGRRQAQQGYVETSFSTIAGEEKR